MKFAFLIMGDFNCNIDRAIIHDGMAQIVGVANIEDACMVAKKLKKEGIDCIELCGAFGEAGAKVIIEAEFAHYAKERISGIFRRTQTYIVYKEAKLWIRFV